MLERIREGSQGPWAIVVVGLIVLSFVFTGVGSYLGGSTSTAAATVNDAEISVSELDTAYQNERARMESQFGEAISAMFSNEETLAEFKSNVLQRLIADKLIEQKAETMGLRVSDEAIKQAIIEMPEFQLLGQFDNETYKARLRQAGFQPADFRTYMRNQMTTDQLRRALTGSDFSLQNEVSALLSLQQQTRDMSSVEINASSFADSIEVSDEEVAEYYQANIDGFDTEEQIRLAYVSLTVDDLLKNEEVDADEVQAYYQQNMANYQTEEQRRVSHILVEFGEDESAAQAKIDAILAQVKASDADFAMLAEAQSEDIVSAEQGGDLDFITRGQMGDAFEEAAFALANVGDTSDVVRTDFGFHIIKLTELKASVTTEFAEVEQEIKANLLRNKATDTFFSLQERMAALAFEVPDTLEDVANAIDRPVIETALFQRGQLPASVDYPQVEGIAFSDELVDEQLNSDLLEISDDKVMVVRVAEHKPQRTLQLDEVKAGIVAQLKQDKTQEAAMAWAQSVESALLEDESGAAAQAILDEKSLAWNTQAGVARNDATAGKEVTDALFALSTQSSNNTDVVKLNNGNVALLKLNKVNVPAQISQQDVDAYKQRFAVTQSRKSFENFVEALKAEAEVVIH